MAANKILPYNPELKKLARKLRKNMTFCEVLLWQEIRRRNLGYQFHRQVPILNYIVDFYCHELLLAIELDGSSHNHPEVSIADLSRQEEIENLGIEFLRFENAEIKNCLPNVIQIIEDWITINSAKC